MYRTVCIYMYTYTKIVCVYMCVSENVPTCCMHTCSKLLKKKSLLRLYVCMYMYVHASYLYHVTEANTHTHIYIYIYIFTQ